MAQPVGFARNSELNEMADGAHPMSSRPRFPWGVLLFTVAYLLPAIVGVFVNRNGEFLFYIVVLLVLMGIVAIVHRRVGLSSTVLWGLSLWGLAHMAGGLVQVPDSWPINGDIRVLYSWWLIPNYLKFDQLVHAYGFGVTTLLCWEGLRSILAGRNETELIQPTFGMLTLCAAAAMGFGALNEVIEFIATLLVPETNVGGYVNTGWDLVSNLVGVCLAAVFISVTQRCLSDREK